MKIVKITFFYIDLKESVGEVDFSKNKFLNESFDLNEFKNIN